MAQGSIAQDAGMAGVARLLDVIVSPTSFVAIALAGAAILGIVLFAKRDGRRPGSGEGPTASAAETTPPLLETPLKVITPGRTKLPLGAPALGRVASGALFAVIGVTAILGAKFLMERGEGTVVADLPPAEAKWREDAVILAGQPCEGGADHAGAFTACGAGVPVTFEAIALSREGEALRDLAWAGEGRRPVVLTERRQPAPFTLDGATDLLLQPGARLSDYDAFVAVGYADEAVDGAQAEARAEARGYALQDFVLDALPRRRAHECAGAPLVHAVSLGARRGEAGPAPRPVLIGLKANSMINGDAGELDAMLEEVFAPEAAPVLGVVPDAYGPWTLLGSQRACDAGGA